MTNRLQGWLLAAAFMAASLAPALAQPVTVSGYVEDATTGERIPGAHLYLPSLENDEVDARPMTNPHYGYLRALHFVHHTIDPLAYPPTIARTFIFLHDTGKGSSSKALIRPSIRSRSFSGMRSSCLRAASVTLSL